MANPADVWDAADYARDGAFVPALGAPVLALLQPVAGEDILDLGCGDGVLTARIAESGARVRGIDSSAQMLAAARARGLDVQQMDAQALSFDGDFDAVFSNAALHWMPDQQAVADGVFRALRPGGRYVGECGGFLNVAAIRTALRAVLTRRGYSSDAGDRQVYHSVESFTAIHTRAGFHHIDARLIARPTPLASGIRGWLRTFRGGFIDAAGVPATQTEDLMTEVEALLAPDLRDADGRWQADYVRLRWQAWRPD